MYCLERPSTTPDTGWTSPSTSLSRSRCCPVDRTLRRIATIDTRGRVRPRTGDLVGVYGLRVCQSATPGQSVPLTAGPTTPRGPRV